MLTIIKKCNQQIQDSGPNPEFDKLYIYALDPYEAKCWLSINKRECADLKHLNDSKDFIKYSNDMDDIFKNIEEYKPYRKCKVLLVIDDMIAEMFSNKES